MTHPQTIRELQRMVEEIDGEMAKLRGLIRQGEAIRAGLVKQIAALGDKGRPPVEIVRIKP